MKLALKNISKTFHQGTNRLSILENLNLEIAAGEIVAIVGESGSGKSTLLALLAGFDQADRGDMVWDQKNAADWNEKKWAEFRQRELGFIFQNYHLIPYLTALENAALPLRLLGVPDPEAQARALLCQLGLESRLHHLPQQLSGGECQRVAIARALIHKPQLVLADEPTGSLDSKTGLAVLDVLFHLLLERRQTALIVTHSQDVAARCHRRLTLRQGQLWPD